jgi:hypothetical protein
MIKLILATAAFLVAASAPALANSQTWNVTEEGPSGIKSGQGQWSVTVDGSNKISGTANLRFDNGKTLTYDLAGSKNESAYTVNMSKRSDGKSGCVWSGHSPANVDPKSHGLIGQVRCDGNTGFLIRAGF